MGGLVCVIMLNLYSDARRIELELDGEKAMRTTHEEFHLTAYPDAADLNSTEVALNGKHLRLTADGAMPLLVGSSSSSSSITLQPKSVVLFAFRQIASDVEVA